ncbi:MAG: ABC transporter substrate-binding protein [Archaeoglobus sp.]|jgi:1,4-dihydroxy-6-naphthoate synthase|nr:MAG: ABC transporter substrate-binding protein [Archaeoglobus sp.]
MKITVAHTPDADDAFMFYAMTAGKVEMPFEVEHVVRDIETLNRMAFENKLDVTAISVHAYAYLSKNYRILSAGASVGDGYGPIVVAKREIEDLGKVAVPGKLTTAFLLLTLACDDLGIEFEPVEMKFDEIIPAIKDGKVDSGLLIHEGQMTYTSHGLTKLIDLWEWWNDKTSLPLPLGVNAINRKFDEETQKTFLRVMKKSIEYALKNSDEAVNYAMKFSRGLSRNLTEKFAKMYVNEYTYEMPESVVKSINTLFDIAEEKGILRKPTVDILFMH